MANVTTNDAQPTAPKFNTFQGVFRPVSLTILGALLYLREGWLVGNAGLGGALLVIAAAYAITGSTALSLASIATNVRVRAGGAFAIISTALGLEAGGAIGIPLYLAQTISSVMYLYAFTEGWAVLFPDHDPRLVVAVAFVGVAALVLRSADLAFKAQGVMVFVVAAALLSAFSGWFGAELQAPVVIGRFPDASLLECFALFFPAATGIMVGVGMSGNLHSPSEAIPKGTLAAWGVTLGMYVLGAVWYATVVPREVLLTDKLAMVRYATVGELVLFGLLSSTLMAALSSLVAAPRLLQAMAAHDVTPRSRWLRGTTADGEPRNATLVTLGIAALGLTAGSLDAIAPIITSFFVMTYLAVNVVVFLEQSLGLVSWRPTFHVRTAVPVFGAVASLFGLLSGPGGGLPEIAFVVGLYVWLGRRKAVDTSWETVQSGMTYSLATWAARKASQMVRSERSWKPDILLPVTCVAEAKSLTAVAEAATRVRGSMKIVGLSDDPDLGATLDAIVDQTRRRGHFSSWHRMVEERPGQGARLSLDAMQGTFFAPNLLLLSTRFMDDAVLQEVVDHARAQHVGVLVLVDDPQLPVDRCRRVAVWLSDRSPDWALGLHVANLDLPVLLAYLLTRPLEGMTALVTVLRDPSARPDAQRFLGDLVELGRLPRTSVHVLDGPFAERLADGPRADVHIFGLSERIDIARMRAIHEAVGAPCLFAQDSGQESALA